MPPIKLGILGGGQLGLMLCQAAMNLGVDLYILDPDPAAACWRYTAHFVQGSLTDPESVFNFGLKVDVLTIEIENVSVSALKRLQQNGVKVYPQPEIIELIQDKGLQKDFFQKKNFVTAPFILLDGKNQISSYLHMLPAVMKLRKAGYDGRGVIKIKSESDIEHGFPEPSILEQQIVFAKEIAVLVARSENGATAVYDPVEMQFSPEANLVEVLLSPARISSEQCIRAQSVAIRLIEELQMVGLLAVEFFLTASGDLLINEVAPRPHNSGHHTIESHFVSQYEQHLRAVLGLPLGSTKSRSPAVLINLLGSASATGEPVYEGLEKVWGMEGAYIHLYGKQKVRPNRKMGHVTLLDNDLDDALAKAEFVQKVVRVR